MRVLDFKMSEKIKLQVIRIKACIININNHLLHPPYLTLVVRVKDNQPYLTSLCENIKNYD